MNKSGRSILIIDDNKTMVMYVGVLLKRMGLEVVAANSAAEGFKLLENFAPDVILLDVVMPDMDGFAVLERLKIEDETADIPVVMMSADSKQESREKCQALGASGYLTKPVTVDRLHWVVENLMIFPQGKRRRYLRVQLNHKVEVEYDGIVEELYAVNLSEGGIYLRKKDPLPVGTEMKVRFPLDDGEVLEFAGRLLYSRELFSSGFNVDPGMAIRFTAVTPTQHLILKTFIVDKLAGDLFEMQEEEVLAVGNLEDDAEGEETET